jgi:Na+-transporting NADH:ubiquinone oxidoreductase subunit C
MATQHSTGYIFGFAAAVCVFFSVFVSGAAVFLKDRQDANKVLDRQAKVLAVAGLVGEGEKLAPEEITERFDANIRAEVVDLATGDPVEGIDAAGFDQRSAAKDPATSREAPANDAKVMRVPDHAMVYQVLDRGEVSRVILPVEGKGLWSTLYGFVALEKDTRTISGITFYEHAETPGLGGEVDNPGWKAGWKGRKAFDDEWKPAIQVLKGRAGSVAEAPYHVDGLSGATITSRGVTHLMRFWLGEHGFGPYLTKLRARTAAPAGGKGGAP